jgi:hypothetical protein
MIDALQELNQFWLKEDCEYLSYLKQELQEFNKLYLHHLDKPLYVEINTMVINDLKNEMEATNARLHKYQAGQRGIRYRLEGNQATAG